MPPDLNTLRSEHPYRGSGSVHQDTPEICGWSLPGLFYETERTSNGEAQMGAIDPHQTHVLKRAQMCEFVRATWHLRPMALT